MWATWGRRSPSKSWGMWVKHCREIQINRSFVLRDVPWCLNFEDFEIQTSWNTRWLLYGNSGNNSCNDFYVWSRDHFYQFGEIRSITIVQRQQCAFVQFTTRAAAEAAAEKTFNKLIINGRRLNIKWGRSQAQQSMLKRDGEDDDSNLEPVPGLPGGMFFKFNFQSMG